jgi:hypothetical protein
MQVEELRTHLQEQLGINNRMQQQVNNLDKHNSVLTLELKQAREDVESKIAVNEELDRRVKELT